MSITNHTHFDREWGMFIGSFSDNDFHQHYGIQLSIALEGEIKISQREHHDIKNESILIKSNVPHKLTCNSNHVLFLLNPTSQMGQFLQNTANEDVSRLEDPMIRNIKKAAKGFLSEKLDFTLLLDMIKRELGSFESNKVPDVSDDRILKALDYLHQNYQQTIPLQEIAEHVNLSPSRFIHLFKEVTNITYRRAQLWNKISQSLQYLKMQSITRTAHQFGFSDSAHYSRIFKQNFGFTPKFLSKL